jgi:hypothetical protein
VVAAVGIGGDAAGAGGGGWHGGSPWVGQGAAFRVQGARERPHRIPVRPFLEISLYF